MNRRSFFSRLLGAACLAVAERVLPSSLSGVAAQWAEPVVAEDAWWLREQIEVSLWPLKRGQFPPCEIHVFGESGRIGINPPGFDLIGCNDYDSLTGYGSWEPYAGHRYIRVEVDVHPAATR